MSKPSQVIVVVEDERHQMLIQRYLKSRGLSHHQIRISASPSGKGSAESWVRRKFVEETKVYRTREARARTELIVVIDADTSTVEDRFSQLDKALSENGDEIVSDGERIARLVPKRNVETWILCLSGQAVDEDEDYKGMKNNWNQMIRAAGIALNDWCQLKVGPPGHCIDSLQRGIVELRRLMV
jgi:hypothetical protein